MPQKWTGTEITTVVAIYQLLVINGIIYSINGVLLVLRTGISGHSCKQSQFDNFPWSFRWRPQMGARFYSPTCLTWLRSGHRGHEVHEYLEVF